MQSLWSRLREKWANWCGDREMEIAIRNHLQTQGVYGRTARLQQVRVIAMQRPGWIQIYRFEAVARVVQDEDSTSEVQEERLFYGLVRDDGRSHAQVVTFSDMKARVDQFKIWSEGMICLRGAKGLTGD